MIFIKKKNNNARIYATLFSVKRKIWFLQHYLNVCHNLNMRHILCVYIVCAYHERWNVYTQLCNLWPTLPNNYCTTDLEYLVRIAETHAKFSHNDRDNIHEYSFCEKKVIYVVFRLQLKTIPKERCLLKINYIQCVWVCMYV